jgi:hypothetical protein
MPSLDLDLLDAESSRPQLVGQLDAIINSIPLWHEYVRYRPFSSRRFLLAPICSGLGNRILGLMAALQFAALTGRQFLFHWVSQAAGNPMQYGVTVPFSRLWLPSSALYREISAWELDEKAREPGLTLVHGKGPDWVVNFADVQRVRTPHVLLASIMACHSAPYPLAKFSRLLCPSYEVSERVQRFRDQHFVGQKVLGVCVRTKAVTHMTAGASPPSWFLTRIQSFLRDNPGWRLFLSMDDVRALPGFLKELPPGIDVCYQNKTAPFASDASMVDALVDLYLLGKSDYMLAPHGSTFHIAALALRRDPRPMGWETSVGHIHFFPSQVV